ncbi:MAG: hypothetical protein GXY33_09855 [Phycisphaerae bacterium]|nr:hypothetical protein [Phycisphaerae bacterium]
MGRIWAIARLTISEAIRTRLAISFMALLAGLIVLIVATASGDGTVAGKVQMFMSHTIGITHLLLSLLVIFLAARMVDQDIRTQRIDSLMTKPLARWQFLAGRWLGILLLATFLLGLVMGASYGVVRFFSREATGVDAVKLENQVLVARTSYRPSLPDVSEQVERIVRERGQDEELAELTPRKMRELVRDRLITASRTVGPQQGRTWTLTGLPKPQEGSSDATDLLTLRFKYEPSKNTEGVAEYQLHSNTILGQWIIGRRESPNQHMWLDAKPYRTANEIRVPINAIEADGTLELSFINRDPRGVAVNFPMEDGIEVLVRSGRFGPNFVRAFLLVLLTLVFLTTLALACSTFLSFPVASLLTVSIFFVGLAGGFLWDSIGLWGTDQGTATFLEVFGKIVREGTVWARVSHTITFLLLHLIPILDVGIFTDRLIDGRMIGWVEVMAGFVKLVAVQSFLLAIFAVMIFRRRELGRVIV